jgi:cell division septation protein DedD
VDAWITGPYNGGYWVQVGAFQNSENIKRVTNALQSRNYRVDTSLTTVQDGTFLRRVLVGGPYTRAGAENELLVIRELVLQ